MVFDAVYYSNKYSDLKSAFGTDAAKLYNHFITSGITEGRQGCATFNVKNYLTKNSDLLAAFGAGNYVAAYTHYIYSGYAESRPKT